MMRWLFDLAWLALLAFIAGTAGLLPAEVGDPGKTLPREAYLALTLGQALFIPWLVTRGSLALVRRHPRYLNLPHKDYWLAAPRREATLAWLRQHLFGIGLMLVLLFAAVHYAALHKQQPAWPQPDALHWLVGAGLLAVWFSVWMIALYRRFSAPPAELPPAHSAQARQPRRPRRPDRQQRAE